MGCAMGCAKSRVWPGVARCGQVWPRDADPFFLVLALATYLRASASASASAPCFVSGGAAARQSVTRRFRSAASRQKIDRKELGEAEGEGEGRARAKGLLTFCRQAAARRQPGGRCSGPCFSSSSAPLLRHFAR